MGHYNILNAKSPTAIQFNSSYSSVGDIVANTKLPVFCFSGDLNKAPLAEFSNAGFSATWITGIIARQDDGAYFLACMTVGSQTGLIAQGGVANKTKFNQFIILN